MSLIAPTVEAFFTERLITQRNASPRTIAAYRDTLRLLLRFASEQTGKQPCRLEFADLDAPLIGAFLNHLEGERGNSITTRNARLAAIHSLYRYATLRHPEEMATIARVIEIPAKRHKRTTISYLEEKEIKALLRAPDLHLARPARPRVAAHRDPDRPSRLGAREPARRRGQPRHRRALSRARQGSQGTVRDSHRRDCRRATHLAGRAPRRAERATIPKPTRWTADPKGDRLAARQARHHRGAPLPIAAQQTRHSARAQAHQRDAAAPPRHRHPHDRAVAGPRKHQIHRDLPARRQQAQTAGDRTRRSDRHSTGQIQAARHATRIPRRAVIIRSAGKAHTPLNRGKPPSISSAAHKSLQEIHRVIRHVE